MQNVRGQNYIESVTKRHGLNMTNKPLNRTSLAFCVIVILLSGCGTPYQPGNYMDEYQATSPAEIVEPGAS